MALEYKYVFHGSQEQCVEVYDMPDAICPNHKTIMDIDEGYEYCVMCETETKKHESSPTPTRPAVYLRPGRN